MFNYASHRISGSVQNSEFQATSQQPTINILNVEILNICTLVTFFQCIIQCGHIYPEGKSTQFHFRYNFIIENKNEIHKIHSSTFYLE